MLVIANQTADSPELVAALQARQQKGPMAPTLLMPAVRNGYAGKEEARERLDGVLAQWREAGLSAPRASSATRTPRSRCTRRGTRAASTR